MRDQYERAIELAVEQGFAAAECEARSRLALYAAGLGAEKSDPSLLDLALEAADKARTIAASLPGHPPWAAQADAASARAYLARGDMESALANGRSALARLEAAMREDPFLEIVLPAAAAVIAAGTDEEREKVRAHLGLIRAQVAQRFLDEDVRARWFRSAVAKELSALAGSLPAGPGPGDASQMGVLGESDSRLLTLVTEGLDNSEIAARSGTTEDEVARQLGELYVKLGASSRADATAMAIMGKLV
jgi:DNA-binding NarL/FixJ family response regulator